MVAIAEIRKQLTSPELEVGGRWLRRLRRRTRRPAVAMGKTQLTQTVQTFLCVRKQLLIGSPVMGPECSDDAVECYARWAGLDGQPYAGSDWIEAIADPLTDITTDRTT